MCYLNSLIKSYNLTQKIYTLKKNALLKVKINLNLNEHINFYHWCELTTEYDEYQKLQLCTVVRY